MLSTALIVFREILEAALVVSIVLAATKGVPRRSFWVCGGLFSGVLGACLIAIFADEISEWASGMGQEIFNALVMLIAVLMLAWHSIWMARHGREMSMQLNMMGQAVASGQKPLTGLAIVVGVAVLREGSETVLFLYGIAAGDPGQTAQMLTGGLLGIAGGVIAGAAIYFGLLRVAMRHLFKVTNSLIILLAAGMASQCMGFLVAADWLPSLGDTVWDSSWLLTDNSIVGKMLHTLIGYTAQPAGIQVFAYVITICSILMLTNLLGQPNQVGRTNSRAKDVVA
jgi:high-affinity iron transporter